MVKLVPSRTVDGDIPAAPTALPTGAIWAQRKVHESGRFMINGQFVKLDPQHAGKIVTIVRTTRGSRFSSRMLRTLGQTADDTELAALQDIALGRPLQSVTYEPAG